MMNWIDAAARLTRENAGFVLVTVLATEGSAPRDADAKMVVTAAASHATIGGGNLEFQATEAARQLLAAGKRTSATRSFTLGAELAQCCGGKVTLLLECFPACGFHIVLCGAGHVGAALAGILGALPCRVTWLDSRADIFPPQVAANTDTEVMRNPFEAIAACPSGAYFLIMTHSHEIDIELCEAVLTRADSRYCGLIGSKSKAAKFRSRLSKKGFTSTELARLTSPIGLTTIHGKTPMEVAVSVAAELLVLEG